MKIALVGNQNSGKTTLFNLLTGSNQKVGNWPGVTIERKSGIIKGTPFEVVDLPGIYSLSPYTSEEEVSRKYVFEEKPDLIINIIDATSIERSLYLTTQLLELDTRVVIALNMTDILLAKGLKIDAVKLSATLNTSVVEISALKRTGIEALITLIASDAVLENPHQKIYQTAVESEIALISQHIETAHTRFAAVKLLENDKMFLAMRPIEVKDAIARIEATYHLDVEQVIASQRYDFIMKVKTVAVTVAPVKKSMTDKLDKIFLNRYLALPIFAVIMFLVYFLSVGIVGASTITLIQKGVAWFTSWVSGGLISLDASPWAVSLVAHGVIGGVGAILNFIPQLMMLFLCISLLETTGYMSRIAFFLDRVFKKFGLSGKSLIPFIVGSGCSVPGVMTTRTIEDPNERQISVLLTPFIPCSAKLPIIALFAGFFFPDSSGFVSFSLYLFAVVIILLLALFLSKFVFKSKNSVFISELPEYKLPSLRYVTRDVGDKTWSFVKRAGTIILVSSIIVWFLASFTWSLQYVHDSPDVDHSMLGTIGSLLAWIFVPMLGGTYSWGAAVSALQGLIAKENVVSSLTVISGVSSGTTTNIFASGGLFSFFTPVTAYAFMVFNLFSAPCFGAIAAMNKEFGSVKKTIYAILLQTGLAWVLASLIGGIGTLIINGLA